MCTSNKIGLLQLQDVGILDIKSDKFHWNLTYIYYKKGIKAET